MSSTENHTRALLVTSSIIFAAIVSICFLHSGLGHLLMYYLSLSIVSLVVGLAFAFLQAPSWIFTGQFVELDEGRNEFDKSVFIGAYYVSVVLSITAYGLLTFYLLMLVYRANLKK